MSLLLSKPFLALVPQKKLLGLQLNRIDDYEVLDFIYTLSSFTRSEPHEVQ